MCILHLNPEVKTKLSWQHSFRFSQQMLPTHVSGVKYVPVFPCQLWSLIGGCSEAGHEIFIANPSFTCTKAKIAQGEKQLTHRRSEVFWKIGAFSLVL